MEVSVKHQDELRPDGVPVWLTTNRKNRYVCTLCRVVVWRWHLARHCRTQRHVENLERMRSRLSVWEGA